MQVLGCVAQRYLLSISGLEQELGTAKTKQDSDTSVVTLLKHCIKVGRNTLILSWDSLFGNCSLR